MRMVSPNPCLQVATDGPFHRHLKLDIYLFNIIICQQEKTIPPICSLPAYFWRIYTTSPFYLAGSGNGFFLNMYTICSFVFCQKVSCVTGSWSLSVITQSKYQKYLSHSLFLYFQELSGHHIWNWYLRFPPSTPIPFTFNPTNTVNRRQKGNILLNITQVPCVLPFVHYLISITVLLPSVGTILMTYSGM